MHNRIKFLDICKKFVHVYNDLMPFYITYANNCHSKIS